MSVFCHTMYIHIRDCAQVGECRTSPRVHYAVRSLLEDTASLSDPMAYRICIFTASNLICRAHHILKQPQPSQATRKVVSYDFTNFTLLSPASGKQISDLHQYLPAKSTHARYHRLHHQTSTVLSHTFTAVLPNHISEKHSVLSVLPRGVYSSHISTIPSASFEVSSP
jgi:hypothetical protein